MSDAREKIASVLAVKFTAPSGQLLDASDAILADMPDIVRGMVKPLEWEDMFEIDPWDTYICNNSYDIQLEEDGTFTLFRQSGGCVGVEFKTMEAAKAAADDHHAAQVLGVLGFK